MLFEWNIWFQLHEIFILTAQFAVIVLRLDDATEFKISCWMILQNLRYHVG